MSNIIKSKKGNTTLMVIGAVAVILLLGGALLYRPGIQSPDDAMEDAMEMEEDAMMEEDSAMEEDAMMEEDVMMEEDSAMEENAMMEEGDMMEEDSAMEEGETMEDDTMMEGGDMMMESSYSGEVLADSDSPVIDFNVADFEKALEQEQLVVLYFYASWCPVCREEVPHMYEAFKQLDADGVVAFRVNYNDSDTEQAEKDLAREHGVAYQHTKVFIKNGERILKSPESWSTDRYLSEIEGVL